MRIFATSDVHGNRLIIGKLQKIKNVDLVLVCGDIGGKGGRFKTLREFGESQLKDAEYLSQTLQSLPIPARFILGNEDWFETQDIIHMDKPEIIGGQELIPFEHVLCTPFDTNREMNDNMLGFQLAKLNAGRSSVIVAHTPPYGCGDRLRSGVRVGSKSVKKWIEEAKPKAWLCGHIHEDNSVRELGATKVFNCACDHVDSILKGWVIDLDTMDFEGIAI
jgi:Icc-related predicted phosphoesterase